VARSYRYPIYTDIGNHRKFYKRLSNKEIRKYLNKLTKGFKSSKLFKQIEETYNICDYKFKPLNEKDYNKAKRK